MRRLLLASSMVLIAGLLSACATLEQRDPVQVTVADIESLPGEDLEVRMLVKLRVQNPNDAPVEYDGIYLKLEVLGSTFATGVSNERGTIPRFSETIISVPMTVSTLRVVARTLGFLAAAKPVEKVNYKLDGKLDGPSFGSTRFSLNGEVGLPGTTPVRAR